MSQEPYKNDNKTKLPKFSNRPGSDGENPKKGPRFSIYWVYAIIFAVLIGLQLFGPFSQAATQIYKNDFMTMLRAGDLESYTVISNRNLVRVKLKKEAISKYQDKVGKSARAEDEFQAFFKVGSVDSFNDDMRDFYRANPTVPDIGKADTETNWFSPILQILPILIFIGLWILLMRKMGGGAGGGGGPGGIFNIGKSKATLFDKGTSVNITFADVAGLDEAKVEVMEIVDFLKNPKKYTALGGKIPKGALLVGPSGNR
jgi:AFG3 family protein